MGSHVPKIPSQEGPTMCDDQPPEAPAVLSAWGDMAGTMLRITQADAELARRMVLANSRAFHALCCFLALRADEAMSDAALAAMVNKISSKTPQLLLAELVAGEALPVLWRAMKAIDESRALPSSQYAALVRWTGLPSMRHVLQRMTAITAEQLAILQVGEDDPLAPYAYRGLEDKAQLNSLLTVLAFLRLHAGLRDDEVTRKSLASVKNPAMLKQWVWRRLVKIRSPITMEFPRRFHLVRTGLELRACALRLKNCLNQPHYFSRLARGDIFLLGDRGTPDEVLVHLSNYGGLYCLEDIRCAGNEPVSEAARDDILLALRAAGLTALSAPVDRALQDFDPNVRIHR